PGPTAARCSRRPTRRRTASRRCEPHSPPWSPIRNSSARRRSSIWRSSRRRRRRSRNWSTKSSAHPSRSWNARASSSARRTGSARMALPWREKLTMLIAPSVFYRRRIAYEMRTGEPELALLGKLVARGSTAVDVGANQGFFAYALAEFAGRVVAFEPNPDYARFARWMLRGRAEVHELALSSEPGHAMFYVPSSDEGLMLHLAGSLRRSHTQFR